MYLGLEFDTPFLINTTKYFYLFGRALQRMSYVYRLENWREKNENETHIQHDTNM